ncbi:hypothetical protein CLU79DRAFT_358802 [Phycomyces nitens]|nr:hypothetical protein CLU79DRAFT_358802 [Phycomyces nitens]
MTSIVSSNVRTSFYINQHTQSQSSSYCAIMSVSLLLSSAMVLGPVVGYVDQTQSSAGFNSATCAILLFANILRIFFWVGKRFDTTLLVQSVVMILAQLILLQVVVEYQHSSPSTLYGDIRSSFSSSSLLDEDLQAEAEGYESRRPCLYRGPRCLESRNRKHASNAAMYL